MRDELPETARSLCPSWKQASLMLLAQCSPEHWSPKLHCLPSTLQRWMATPWLGRAHGWSWVICALDKPAIDSLTVRRYASLPALPYRPEPTQCYAANAHSSWTITTANVSTSVIRQVAARHRTPVTSSSVRTSGYAVKSVPRATSYSLREAWLPLPLRGWPPPQAMTSYR